MERLLWVYAGERTDNEGNYGFVIQLDGPRAITTEFNTGDTAEGVAKQLRYMADLIDKIENGTIQ